MTQHEKYIHLQDYLSELNYDFLTNTKVKSIFENVLSFFQNRSKLNNLHQAQEDVLKLTQNLVMEPLQNDSKINFSRFSIEKANGEQTEDLIVN